MQVKFMDKTPPVLTKIPDRGLFCANLLDGSMKQLVLPALYHILPDPFNERILVGITDA